MMGSEREELRMIGSEREEFRKDWVRKRRVENDRLGEKKT
jgi:hypothetical protein